MARRCLGLAAVELHRGAPARFGRDRVTSYGDGADEEPGNRLSREMTAHDRIRLTGPLLACPPRATAAAALKW